MNTGEANETTLNSLLLPLFWDFRPECLRLGRDRDLIIGRVLSEGNWEQIQWLRRELGDSPLRCWLLKSKGRILSRRQLCFWGLIFDLPSKEIEECLNDPRRRIWDEKEREPDAP